jgi:hypothetical protein
VGPAAPDFSNQIHDFDLGITPDGLFWTVPLGANSLTVDPGNGRASLKVTDLAAFDYFSLPNAFSRGAFEPAVVSFELHWARGLKKTKIRDQVNGFAFDGVLNSATMSWTASSAGETYQSAPEKTSFSLFAEVGHERNGVFFPQGE